MSFRDDVQNRLDWIKAEIGRLSKENAALLAYLASTAPTIPAPPAPATQLEKALAVNPIKLVTDCLTLAGSAGLTVHSICTLTGLGPRMVRKALLTKVPCKVKDSKAREHMYVLLEPAKP